MINLIPSDLKVARIYGRRSRTLFGYSVLLILIGLSSALVLFFNSRLIARSEASLRDEITQIESQSSELKEAEKHLSDLASDIETIEKLYSGEIAFSLLLPEIGGLLPAGTVLNGLTLTGDNPDAPLTLEIDMQSQELAAVFQQNLVNSDLFAAADVVLITSKGEATDGYSYSASISAVFNDGVQPTTNPRVESDS